VLVSKLALDIPVFNDGFDDQTRRWQESSSWLTGVIAVNEGNPTKGLGSIFPLSTGAAVVLSDGF